MIGCPVTGVGNVVVVTVRFFARLREALATDSLEIDIADTGATVAAVAHMLAAQHGPFWQEQLLAPNTLVAVNGLMASQSDRVVDGDEVAFFPPVTGG
jgi:sulfur-carrier protein